MQMTRRPQFCHAPTRCLADDGQLLCTVPADHIRRSRPAQASLLVMEYLPPPADVLRRSLTAGGTFPQLAPHIAAFMARTLFATSLFALDSKAWRCVLYCASM